MSLRTQTLGKRKQNSGSLIKSGMGRQYDERERVANKQSRINWKQSKHYKLPDNRMKFKDAYVWRDSPGKTEAERIDSYIMKHGGYPAEMQMAGAGPSLPTVTRTLPILIPPGNVLNMPEPDNDFDSLSDEKKTEAIQTGRYVENLRDRRGSTTTSPAMLARLNDFFQRYRNPVPEFPELELTPVEAFDPDDNRVYTDDEDDYWDDKKQESIRQRNVPRKEPDPDPDPDNDPVRSSSSEEKKNNNLKKAGLGLGAGAVAASTIGAGVSKKKTDNIPPHVNRDPDDLPTNPPNHHDPHPGQLPTNPPDRHDPHPGQLPTPSTDPAKSSSSKEKKKRKNNNSKKAGQGLGAGSTSTSTTGAGAAEKKAGKIRHIHHIDRDPDDVPTDHSHPGQLPTPPTDPAPSRTTPSEVVNSEPNVPSSMGAVSNPQQPIIVPSSSKSEEIEDLSRIDIEGEGHFDSKGYWRYRSFARDYYNQEGLIYNSKLRKQSRFANQIKF